MLLDCAGIPVPSGRTVADADAAWAFAEELGAPVVVKPRYGNHGRGVTANLSTREQVAQAFAAAREEGSTILCERYRPPDSASYCAAMPISVPAGPPSM